MALKDVIKQQSALIDAASSSQPRGRDESSPVNIPTGLGRGLKCCPKTVQGLSLSPSFEKPSTKLHGESERGKVCVKLSNTERGVSWQKIQIKMHKLIKQMLTKCVGRYQNFADIMYEWTPKSFPRPHLRHRCHGPKSPISPSSPEGGSHLPTPTNPPQNTGLHLKGSSQVA